jgi:hypothetical protein
MTAKPIALICVLLTTAAAAPPLASPDDAAMAASRALATQFQQELGGALQTALKIGGAAGAVTACATIAPEVADRLAAQSGASVRRTALRRRNPLAVPDAYERSAMTELAAAPVDSTGKPAEVAGWTGSGPDRRFRYVRAIPTGGMCLSCHGKAIAPDVAAAIAAAYPGDTATGFAAGEMRGAFSISWTADALAARTAAAAPR